MVFPPFQDYLDPNSNWQQQLPYQLVVENGSSSSSRRGPSRLVSMAEQARIENVPRPAPESCPRCGSGNTKFCYYNNKSLSQPRYWCRNCRRHWTNGGTLRHIPSGGNRRGRRRPTASSSAATSAVTAPVAPGMESFYNMNGFDDTVAPPPPPPPPPVLPHFQFHLETELPSFDIGNILSDGFNDNIGHDEFGYPN